MRLYLNMNEDLKQEWLKALRSGEYKQTEGQLRADESQTYHGEQGFCCLGVLVDISKRGYWVEHEYDDENDYKPNDSYEMELHENHYSMSETLNNAVLDEFGIPHDSANLLMGLNDGGHPYRHHTFKEIADIIEQDIYMEPADDE